MIESAEHVSADPTPCSSLKTNGDACRIHARWQCISCGVAYCGIHVRRVRMKFETVALCQLCATEVIEIPLRKARAPLERS